MTIMPVLIGFCYEQKKAICYLLGDNTLDQFTEDAVDSAIYSYAIKVSAFIHLLCSEGTNINVSESSS